MDTQAHSLKPSDEISSNSQLSLYMQTEAISITFTSLEELLIVD